MILAAHLSYQTKALPIKALTKITASIKDYYKNAIPNCICEDDYDAIQNVLKHDKKNTNGQVNFILLSHIGKPILDCKVTNNEIVNALDYYSSN